MNQDTPLQLPQIQPVETATRFTIAVAVVIARSVNPASKWGYPAWQLSAILAGAELRNGNPVQKLKIHDDGAVQRFFHGGLQLNLYKDGSEGYWYNLLSEQPFLFVVCEGEQGACEIAPMYVTANQDEAIGHLESEDIVLSAPMPVEIRELLERYVVNHYQPAQHKKRKRKNWVADSPSVTGCAAGQISRADGSDDKKS